MRKMWILLVCAGLVGFAWQAPQPAQAAMPLGISKANQSLVELAGKKKRSRAQCTDYLQWTCCTEPGKPETCRFKLM